MTGYKKSNGNGKNGKKWNKKRYNKQRPGKTNTTISFYSPSTFAAGGMSSRYTTKLRYTDFFTLTPAAGNGYVAHQIFQTSCHDVDNTGVGHQPYMWDQLRPFYRYYIVHGMQWKATAIKGSASGHFATLSALNKSKSSFITSVGLASERQDQVTKVLNNDGTACVVEGYIGTTRPWGLPKKSLSLDSSWYGGAASSSDPAKMSYLHFYVQSKDGTDLTVEMQVELIIYVTMFDLEALPQS